MADKLKLIKYGHEYCGPCKMLAPVLKQIADECTDKIIFDDRDTYQIDPSELTTKNIKAVPTMILESSDGVELWRHVGLMSKDSIVNFINKFYEESL